MKLGAALAVLEAQQIDISSSDNDEIYELLQEHGYIWHTGKRIWEKHAIKPSVFDDSKAGYVRVRVAASPERIEEAVNVIAGYFPEVLEVSEKYYNSKDIGVRVYLLVKLGS